MTEVKGDGATGSRVTIHDVAALAGVSVATVSRVLNGHPDVSPATRTEVLRQVRELGYVSNRASAPTPEVRTKRRPRLIGLGLPDIPGERMTEIMAGAIEALHDYDARLVVCSNGRTRATLRDVLMPGLTDGALLVLPSDSRDELTSLQESGYPFVVIEPAMPLDDSVPTVAAANWAGAKRATEYLIDLGHTHVGVIAGPADWQVSQDRLAGYQAALLSAGLPLVPHLKRSAGLTAEEGYRAASELLGLPHAPTAIVTFNTPLAVGLLRAARERGLQIPSELSILSLEDAEVAALMAPALTAVRQPLRGEGRVGAGMLFRLLEGQQLDAWRMELSTELIIRESTAAPSGTSFLT